MGCVLPAGQGQAPARQAARKAGLPDATGATTVNKVCGSGMKATMLAHDLIAAGSADIVVAGGMESMSNAPYLLAKARGGYRVGHDRILDHMMLDGLEDAYEAGPLHGRFRRGGGPGLSVHPRRPGCLRRGDADARPQGDRERSVRRRDRAHLGAGEGRRARGRERRAPDEGLAREDPVPQAGVPRRRHHHGRQRLGQRRRRRGADPDAPVARRARGPADPGRDQGARHPLARSPPGTPPRRSRRSASCSARSAGRSATSTCSRSTRRSPSSPWRRSATSPSRATSSTSTAARARSAIPIGATGARLIVTLLRRAAPTAAWTAASPRSASAAAKPPRSRSSACTEGRRSEPQDGAQSRESGQRERRKPTETRSACPWMPAQRLRLAGHDAE